MDTLKFVELLVQSITHDEHCEPCQMYGRDFFPLVQHSLAVLSLVQSVIMHENCHVALSFYSAYRRSHKGI